MSEVIDLDMDGDSTTLPYNADISMSAMAADATVSPITFRQALHGIRTGRWRKQVETVREAHRTGGKAQSDGPKRHLPGVVFSGKFSYRSASKILSHSGLICADIDKLGDQVGAYKERFSADPHVIAAFVSPTETGLKAIFRCDPTKPHKESFEALEYYVITNFGVTPDEKCSDCSRLCFVSYDPELFETDDAEIIPYLPKKIAQPSETRAPLAHNGTGQPGDDFNLRGAHQVPDLLRKHGWTHYRGPYWCRPGKDNAVSASLGIVAENVFHPFSNSPETRLPSDKEGFDPFALYTHLEHAGDFKAAARALAKQGYGTPSRQQQNLERIAGPEEDKTAVSTKHRTPFSFVIPPHNDRSILLGNRYLNRGDGMVLSSSSGMGKSSMSHQMAADWGLGKPFHGISPNGPLKSLIVQSEDSDGDMAEVWQSLAHVNNYTAAQRTQLDQNVRIISERRLRGAKFIAWLKAQVADFKPDLVWINPLQSFIDGDVTDSKDIGEFLREGLNGINAKCEFGYVIVHHTTKPATGKDRSERLWHEVMYDMAGGAEIINWARAIMSLRPLEAQGEFCLRLAKRGRRAGVVKMVDHGVGQRAEPTTEIGLKHATGKMPDGVPVIYWEAHTLPSQPKKGKSTGREEKHSFEDFRSVLPKKTDPGRPFNQILQSTQTCAGGITKGSLLGVLKRWAEAGDLEIIKPEVGPMLFRCNY